MSPKHIIVGLAALLLSAAAVRAETANEIYAKAKSEGALVFYAGGPTAPWEAAATLFKQKYPGISVKIEGGFSNVLDRKIDDQIKAGQLEVDAAFFQTVQDYVRWKKEGNLLPSKPDGFDKINSAWKDKDGAYIGLSVNAHPYAYNTQLVKPADVPKSALDFLKPEFMGKVVAPTRRTTTRRSTTSTASLRNMAGATGRSISPTSPNSSRAISASRAASRPATIS